MTAPLVVLGSAVLDRVTVNESSTDHPGGAALNTAVAARRLGIPTTLFAAIEDDEAGVVV
jgi:sugar/nucleoside kinase (ribokinase family)